MSVREVVRDWLFADDPTVSRYNLPDGEEDTKDGVLAPDAERGKSFIQTTAESRNLRRQSVRNGYMRRSIEIVVAHVVGKNGIKIIFQNKRIQKAFDAWAKTKIDVSGKLDLFALERLATRNFMREGEVFLQKRPKNQSIFFEVRDSQELQRERHHTGSSGGIELDEDYRPLKYHFRDHDTEGEVRVPNASVDAREIIHVFEADYPRQQRGIGPLLATKDALNALKGYEANVLYNAQVTAAEPGHYEVPAKYLTEDEEEDEDTKSFDNQMRRWVNVKPGQRRLVPEGVKWNTHELGGSFDGGNYSEYRRGMLTEGAAGVPMAYATFSSDLRDANYSSLRQGVIEDGMIFGMIQRLLSELIDEVIVCWFENDGSSLPLNREYEYSYQGVPYIDPVKEAASEKQRLLNRTTSRSSIIRERGDDPAKVFSEIYEEEKQLKKLKLLPVEFEKKQPAASSGSQQSKPKSDDDKKDKDND